ncbi:uracil phosphoribosyltransferase [Abyssalbus ytuae]|uniref:Uracil phosphoribosyltransferase n=1 Tax=Abyssalbus ytuae TaxID=2926907 RepID=A0A9E7CU50_9FLAO|nr:uracil phosphoribosyltransferase [Abyssalbus ytuae]UOB19436.1 uracil phosphoribosyltransferase [Abyssalbus ytuae]
MKIHHIAGQNSVLNKFLAEIRDVTIQKDRLRFRRNIERIGEILAYELSKSLPYKNIAVTTPLGEKNVAVNKANIVLCSVLRAGLPLHQGLLNYFDDAENSFISAYRHHKNGGEVFEIIVEYLASPSLENKTLILADPMLATGQSLVSTFEALKSMGKPEEIHLVSVVGAREGIDYVNKHFPGNTHLWIADIDPELNQRGYIVPGLGDAGDLAYGMKKQS